MIPPTTELAHAAQVAAAGWPFWTGLGLLGAVLVADDTAWAQTWLSQPLPAALLAGLATGDPQSGAAAGAVLQLIAVGAMPVGQAATGELTSAAIAATGALHLRGVGLRPDALFGGSGATLLGWIVLGACAWSLLAGVVVRWERRGNQRWMLAGNRFLRRGALGGFELLQGLCLAIVAVRGAVMTLLGILVLGRLWIPLLERVPAGLGGGMGLPALVAPPLAVGVLVDHFGWRTCWRWLLAGAALGFAAARGLG